MCVWKRAPTPTACRALTSTPYPSTPSTRCRALIRRGNLNTSVSDGFEPAVTDNGNYVVDLFFAAPIKDVAAAAKALDAFPVRVVRRAV